MNKKKLWADLFEKIAVVTSVEKKNALIESLKVVEKPTILSFVNAHGVNLCFERNDFSEDLLASDWLLRDGSGMKLAYRYRHEPPGLNMNGTDFIPEILSRFGGERCLIFGTKNPNLALAVDKISALGLEVMDHADGFQELDLYLKKARQCRVKLILLGMGMPKQERLSRLLKSELDYPVLIINGGAILDFLSGNIKRSPKLFRYNGMEWLWRLLLEPSRMWKRYLVGNVKFLVRMGFARDVKYTNDREMLGDKE